MPTYQKAGFDSFREHILKVVWPFIANRMEADKGTFTKVDRSSMSRKELIAADLFARFMEISNSLDRLHEILSLLRNAPPRTAKISKVQYLTFLVEAYLNELFLLRERLRTLAIWISRRLRRSKPGLATRMSRLAENTARMLDRTTEARSRHVHESRFSTEDLIIASNFEFLAQHTRGDRQHVGKWISLADVKYKDTREDFVLRISEQLDGIKKIVDIYFDAAGPVVFGELVQSLEEQEKA